MNSNRTLFFNAVICKYQNTIKQMNGKKSVVEISKNIVWGK